MGQGRRLVGAAGEEAAQRFLEKEGYCVRARNVRTPFGEIDIVARHNRTIVFVEVKTRSTFSLGPGYLSITEEKKRHLVKNALFYLKRHGLSNSIWRIDVVSVKLTSNLEIESIEHFVSAVEDW